MNDKASPTQGDRVPMAIMISITADSGGYETSLGSSFQTDKIAVKNTIRLNRENFSVESLLSSTWNREWCESAMWSVYMFNGACDMAVADLEDLLNAKHARREGGDRECKGVWGWRCDAEHTESDKGGGGAEFWCKARDELSLFKARRGKRHRYRLDISLKGKIEVPRFM